MILEAYGIWNMQPHAKEMFHQLFFTALKIVIASFIIKIYQKYHRNNEILKQLLFLEDFGDNSF